jgi:Fic family protein
LLSTLCLYRAGYDFKRLFAISEYYDRDRSAFYRAIQSVRERGMDLTGWLEFFTEGLATQLDGSPWATSSTPGDSRSRTSRRSARE